MKKVSHLVKSDRVCVSCGKPLKTNLVMKRPDADKCWECFYPEETKRKGGHGNGRQIKNF